MNKQEAITDYQRRRKENNEKSFQCKVDAILAQIAQYSDLLRVAKKELAELEYEEPEDLDV